VPGYEIRGSLPRLSRLDAPGVLHHIMIRGIERRKIFLNRRDHEDFLDRPTIRTQGKDSEGLKLQIGEKNQKRRSKRHDTGDDCACSFALFIAENGYGPAYDG